MNKTPEVSKMPYHPNWETFDFPERGTNVRTDKIICFPEWEKAFSPLWESVYLLFRPDIRISEKTKYYR